MRCGPENLKPVVRRVAPKSGETLTTWEIEFDLSSVAAGKAVDLEIEATVQGYVAKQMEDWLRYRPVARTAEASVWAMFPESRPYRDYRLIRYSKADPSSFQEVDTLYTIDHPRGAIIAWSIINPDPDYLFVCKVETD